MASRAVAKLDLVGIAEIAARVGVTGPAVANWRKRHADFPAPYVSLAMGGVWEWAPVRAWCVAHGRLPMTSS